MYSKLKELKSPIFWRIAAGVFVSILLIETVLLVFSWFSERQRLLSQLEETAKALTSVLDEADPAAQLDRLINAGQQTSKFKVIGYHIELGDSTQMHGGDVHGLENRVGATNPNQFFTQTGIYDTYLISGSSNNTIRLRVDARSINDYMVTYIARITNMIIVISLFVTLCCLLFLTPLLINPLQRLNNMLIQGRKHGIRDMQIGPADLKRSDELGSVFNSFNFLTSELISSENTRRDLLGRFEDFANLSADCFFELDSRLRISYIAGDVERVLSLDPAQCTGQSIPSLLSELSDRIPESHSLFESLKSCGRWEGAIRHNQSDKEPLAIRITATAQRTEDGKVGCIRGTIVDITQETRLAEKLHWQATHDELTGLQNRRELARVLTTQIEEYQIGDHDFSMAVLDLDRFKTINDTCGHIAGDQLLKSLAALMRDNIPAESTVFRTGGDEFSLILPGLQIREATLVASDILKAIEGFSFQWNDEMFAVTVSIGLAEMSSQLTSAEEITFAADNCCLEAKRAGKNQIRISSGTTAGAFRSRDEARWISKIKQALEQDRFALFRQSIVKIGSTSAVDHFEVLLRMREQDGSYCSPADFLPIAERNGLMPDIDRWVVTAVGHWFEKLQDESRTDYCISINLSPDSLSHGSFREFLLRWVAEHTHIVSSVCFEITESAAMIDFESTIELLAKLREQGARVALDDFGTGFSSLSHIRELPLDYIKIDGSFVRNINSNSLDQAVVKSVTNFAQVLNISTIAEYVESEEALALLDNLHVDYAQGFLFSEPRLLYQPAPDSDISKAA